MPISDHSGSWNSVASWQRTVTFVHPRLANRARAICSNGSQRSIRYIASKSAMGKYLSISSMLYPENKVHVRIRTADGLTYLFLLQRQPKQGVDRDSFCEALVDELLRGSTSCSAHEGDHSAWRRTLLLGRGKTWGRNCRYLIMPA